MCVECAYTITYDVYITDTNRIFQFAHLHQQNNKMLRILATAMVLAATEAAKLTSDELSSSIRLVQLGDWGGTENPPYSTPSQRDTAAGMGTVGEEISAQYVLALGDNFYHSGVGDTCTDPRFEETWNSVYTAPSMMIPWLVNAGNHDHNGNVTSQIAYTQISDRWIFPALYHKRTLYSDDGSLSVDIILMDTTTYTGINSGGNYPASPADPTQQQWIEDSLKYSIADYIIVGSHYPVYSVCEHGNVLTMVNNIKPLLEKYNAHLMSGHDHCVEHFVVNDINYWLNGIGHGCW